MYFLKRANRLEWYGLLNFYPKFLDSVKMDPFKFKLEMFKTVEILIENKICNNNEIITYPFLVAVKLVVTSQVTS